MSNLRPERSTNLNGDRRLVYRAVALIASLITLTLASVRLRADTGSGNSCFRLIQENQPDVGFGGKEAV